MVMTSQEIASRTGAFQQQAMMQMQHSSMLSQYAGSRNQYAAENFTGKAMNTAGAIGQPVAQGGMMLAGLDPMSMGMRAAWGARGAGMIGAGVAGVGAASGVGAVMMGAQYAGTQMFRGAQQQQQIGQQLRTYQFANQYGGRGFSSGENSGMGQMMRQMSTQRGPGGEFATMDELGRLASNMGRLGLAQNVRSAKDFSDQFKKMMKTVKEVATTLSTSLEEAQKTMASMKSAGVFRASQQTATAAAIRRGVVAGGRTQEEMGQIGMIGAETVRAFGGRGYAGSQAGMKALTQIGAAHKAGVLSEEDIYNQTGQTGAAGMQAMAAQSIQHEQSWLKTGKGRWMTAALAGKDGKLDRAAVERFRRGDFSTGDTQALAQKNLSKVGRANFIRNEQRLKGEISAEFAGEMPAIALKSWMETRKLSIEDMDDRNMLFFQRHAGMDVDTAENAAKMIRDAPKIEASKKQSEREDKLMRALEVENRGKGIQGVKRQLEDARNKINSSLQQTGADIYTEAQNALEGLINRVTGQFVQTVDRDVGPAIDAVMGGGRLGREAAKDRFGMGQAKWKQDAMALGREAQGSIFGKGGASLSADDFIVRNQQAFKEAGWDIGSIRKDAFLKGGVSDDEVRVQLEKRLKEIEGVREGMSKTDTDALALGSKMRSQMQHELISSGYEGKGKHALSSFEKSLARMSNSNPEAKKMYEKWQDSSDAERATIMASMREGAGAGRGQFQMGDVALQGLFSSGNFGTIADRHRAIGAYALGGGANAQANQRMKTGAKWGGAAAGAAYGGVLGGAIGSIVPVVGTVAGATVGAVGGGIAGYMGVSSLTDKGDNDSLQVREGYGGALDSEQGQAMARRVLSENKEEREMAREELVQQREALMASVGGEKDKLDERAKGQLKALEDMGMSLQVMDKMASGGMNDADWEQLAADRGQSVEQVKNGFGAVAAGVLQHQAENVRQLNLETRMASKERLRELKARGIVGSEGTVKKEALAGVKGIGTRGDKDNQLMDPMTGKVAVGESLGELALKSLIEADVLRSKKSVMGDTKEDGVLEMEAQKQQEISERMLDQMTVQEREAWIKSAEAGGGLSKEKAERLRGEVKSQKSLEAKKAAGLLRNETGANGKKIERLEVEGYYETVAADMGIKGFDVKKGTSAANAREDLANKLFGSAEESAKLEASYGVSTGAARKTLSELEKARATGDTNKIAKLEEDLKDQMGPIKAAQEKKGKDEAAKNDPGVQALNDIKGLLSKTLKVSVSGPVETTDGGSAKAGPSKGWGLWG